MLLIGGKFLAYTKGNSYFNFDGRSSRDFGIEVISTSGGMYEDILMASRSINKSKPTGRTKSMLQSITEEDIQFPLEIAFTNGFTDQLIEDVVLWLKTPYYRPFYFEEQPNRLFNLMISDSSALIHNGLKEGYITLTAQTNSPRVYSPIKLTSKTEVTTTKNIEIVNNGHETIYPEISLTINDGTTVKLETLKENNEVENIFEIKNLTKGEDLYLNCYREIIESDIVGVYHYDDTVGHYPSFNRGKNILKITGNCTIQLRYQEEYIF